MEQQVVVIKLWFIHIYQGEEMEGQKVIVNRWGRTTDRRYWEDPEDNYIHL